MQKQTYSRMGFSLLISWTMALAMQFVMDVICEKMFPSFYISPYYYWVIYIICVYVVQVPTFVLLCGGRGVLRPVYEKNKITVGDFCRLIVMCISLTYIFNMVGHAVNDYISTIVGYKIVNPLNALDNTNAIMRFVCSCLITPFTEEVMFRGVMLKKLRPYGEKAAIWFSAVAFGLFHGNFSQFFYALALGLVFASVFVKTNRLIYTILLHVVINITGSVVFPNLIISKNHFVANTALYALLSIIVMGVIIAAVMYPKLKSGDKMEKGSIGRMLFNPGSICFLAFSGFMFYSAIVR